MAAAKSCDACGKFFKYVSKQDSENGIVIYHFNRDSEPSKALENWELCSACMKKIHAILDVEVDDTNSDDEDE